MNGEPNTPARDRRLDFALQRVLDRRIVDRRARRAAIDAGFGGDIGGDVGIEMSTLIDEVRAIERLDDAVRQRRVVAALPQHDPRGRLGRDRKLRRHPELGCRGSGRCAAKSRLRVIALQRNRASAAPCPSP